MLFLELTEKDTGFKKIINAHHIVEVLQNREFCYVYLTRQKEPLRPEETYEEIKSLLEEGLQ